MLHLGFYFLCLKASSAWEDRKPGLGPTLGDWICPPLVWMNSDGRNSGRSESKRIETANDFSVENRFDHQR